ncbi:hypothetical protein WMY93_012980 [Mugilogobius chulae]|uniref:Transmembrane 6 superfamily member 1 n=1 Tax=Mugilogobius chulae TaxID=88201 RepID=A0AAW0P271_9GOBI
MSASAGTGVFVLSLTSIPLCYLSNSLICSESAEALFYAGCATLVTLCISGQFILSKKAPSDPLFYAYAVFAFLSVVNLIIGLEQDNIIDGFVTFYLKETDPHINTAHGHMISYWDGCVHYLMYLLMIAAITWGYRAIGLYWVGSFLMRETPRKSLFERPMDLLFVIYLIPAFAFCVFRGLIALDCSGHLCQDYTQHFEPYLRDPTAYPKVQMLVSMLYSGPYYILALYALIVPGCHWMPDLTLVHSGALAQAQFSHIGASLHTRTPFSFRVPLSSQPLFLLVNVIYALVPQLLCYRCFTRPHFFLPTSTTQKQRRSALRKERRKRKRQALAQSRENGNKLILLGSSYKKLMLMNLFANLCLVLLCTGVNDEAIEETDDLDDNGEDAAAEEERYELAATTRAVAGEGASGSEEFRQKMEREEAMQRRREEEERLIKEEWEARQRKEQEEQEQRRQEKRDREEAVQKRLDEAESQLENGGVWTNPEAPAADGSKNYGTERDVANCPFFLKTGACRFGDRCSRKHVYPSSSTTLLVRSMFFTFGMEQSRRDDYDMDSCLEHSEEELREHFIDFYHDVLPEFRSIGKVVQFKVSCNYESHLRGNVYVQFETEEQCQEALVKFNGRWYAGRQLQCELCPVTRWKNAICGLFDRQKCPKGKNCNFLHVFRNPGNEFWEADRDLSPNRMNRREGWHSERRGDRSWRQRSPPRSERSHRGDRWYEQRGSRSRFSERRHRSRSRSRDRSRQRSRSRDRGKSSRTDKDSRSRSKSRERARSKRSRSPKQEDDSPHKRHKHSKRAKGKVRKGIRRKAKSRPKQVQKIRMKKAQRRRPKLKTKRKYVLKMITRM